MFSKACEYGIKAMIFIAQCNENHEWVSLKAISGEIASPEAFTAKILQKLSRQELLISNRGATGGFRLAVPARDINLAQIVSAIDGEKVFTACGLGLDKCNAQKPCPVHHKFAAVRDELAKMLYTTSLEEPAKGLKEGISFLTR